MTRSMLQRIRPRQESYWHFSDDGNCSIGLVKDTEATELCVASPCSIEPVSVEPSMNLETALAKQTHYTSWPGSIWEPNFEDADGEIIFEFSNIVEDENDAIDCGLRKSIDTADTEEETMPSCSSPDFQNLVCELDALDLSDIVEEEFPVMKHPIVSDCALLTCSADLQTGSLAEKERVPLKSFEVPAATTNDSSNVLLVDGLFDRSGETRKDNSPCSLDPNHRKKSIRFADEEGEVMETVHLVENGDEHDDTDFKRMLILLLLPKGKKFEFLHAQYRVEARVSVSVLLEQLPSMATDPLIACQRYIRLCRAEGRGELINALAIQDYALEQDEVLIAVVQGYTGKETSRIAKTLVENSHILRAVKRRNRCEHTLHQVKTNEEFSRIRAKTGKEASVKGTTTKQDITKRGLTSYSNEMRIDIDEIERQLVPTQTPNHMYSPEGLTSSSSRIFRQQNLKVRAMLPHLDEVENNSTSNASNHKKSYNIFGRQRKKFEKAIDKRDKARQQSIDLGSTNKWSKFAKKRLDQLRAVGFKGKRKGSA